MIILKIRGKFVQQLCTMIRTHTRAVLKDECLVFVRLFAFVVRFHFFTYYENLYFTINGSTTNSTIME